MRKMLSFLLCASLVLSLIPGKVQAARLDEKKQYIVKYTEASSVTGEDGLPVDVLPGADAQKALDQGITEWVEEDREVAILAGEWDEYQVSLPNVRESFELGCQGQDVTIAVLDSGYNPHDELEGAVLPGYNALDQNEDVHDSYGHGTMIAGLIAAQANGTGIVGIAPMAKIVPIKCFDGSRSSTAVIMRAMLSAVDDFHCQILNMSFTIEFEESSKALHYAAEHARECGAMMVASVGNYGTEDSFAPAEWDEVIGVGAADQSGSVWAYSQHNNSVFITAPGVSIYSTGPYNNYLSTSGTSYASAIVSGAVAVLLAMNPNLTFDEVKDLLREGADDRGLPGYDPYYGYGTLNIGRSVKLLKGRLDLLQYHSVECERTVGGIVKVSTPTCAAGYPVTIFASPNRGYLMGKVTVTDDRGENVYTIAQPDGTYTFTMPNRDVTVKVTFEKIHFYQFSDVSPTAYYADAVNWALANEITQGTTATTFSPNEGCTRAQVVTFLWRACGCPEPRNSKVSFKDVAAGSYYETAVAWAVENGITNGTGNNRFSPNALCTREQVVTFLWRYAGLFEASPSGTADLNKFQDVKSLSSYARESARWAISNGILQGDGKSLMPQNTCTRAQVVTFLYRYACLQESK